MVYISDTLQAYTGRKVTAAGGYSPMTKDWISGKKLVAVRTWGKHLLFEFKAGTVRIHLMLFGSLLINKRKKVNASFFLRFGKDELNFYVVKAEKITEPLQEIYDWRTDIMSKDWDAAFVLQQMTAHGDQRIGDLLMDQEIFTGVGNIIRNEVLFRAKLHPLSVVKNIPLKVSRLLLKEIRKYAKQFLKEKKAGVFGDKWQVYQQETCPDDGSPLIKGTLGKIKRKTHYCANCQLLYAAQK